VEAGNYGGIVGNDFAGTVEELGPDVPEGVRTIGERVAGVIMSSQFPFLLCAYQLPPILSQNFVQLYKAMGRTQNISWQTPKSALCPSLMAGHLKMPRSSASRR
jgi:hypothetical protein